MSRRDLRLRVFLDSKLVRIATAARAVNMLIVGDKAEVRAFLKFYLSPHVHYPNFLLPSINEVKLLHKAVCYFAKEFLAETWAAMPVSLPKHLRASPTYDEILRVRHTLYVHETFSRMCGTVNTWDRPVMARELHKIARKTLSCNESILAMKLHRFLYQRIDSELSCHPRFRSAA